MRRFPLGVGISLAVSILLVAPLPLAASSLGPAAGSGSLHDIINLKRDHFLSFEHASPALVEVARCCHGGGQASVSLSSTSGSAEAGNDFTATSRTITFTQPVSADEVAIPLMDDEAAEPLERFSVEIDNPTNGASISFPSRAEVTIIDDDGPPRISMLTPAEEVFENRGPLDLTVVRSGVVTASATVEYTTVDSTSTAAEDYTAVSGTLTFGAGERLKRVRLTTIDDETSEGAETFDFTLSSPEGAEITEPAVTTVTIADNEDSSSDTEPPITAFHQPLDGKTYSAEAARDVLIFADDEGSGVRYVDFALQQKMRSGVCRWYTPGQKRFVRRPCGDKKWIRLPGADVAVYTLADVLRSSTSAARVRFYKAFSRGVDELGNAETDLERKRNVSRFDIR